MALWTAIQLAIRPGFRAILLALLVRRLFEHVVSVFDDFVDSCDVVVLLIDLQLL